MNRISIRMLVSIILVYITAQKLAAQSRPAEKDLQELMRKFEATGLNVAVVKGGRLVYQHAFGQKDKGSGTNLAMNDLFRIASISKSFSATAIMQLVESGKVSLDTDFGQLIGFRLRNPKFPQTPITLRMVLSHTSSINDSQGYFNFDVINPEKNAAWEKCYDAYEPGKGYAYCNLNFNMAGAVIEKISGERFDRYIQNHILKPLQIKGGYNVDSLDKSLFTTLYEYDTTSRKFSAAPAAYSPRTEEISTYIQGYTTPVFSPTGGMKISVPDLAVYMTMHMNKGKYPGGTIISPESEEIMQTEVPFSDHYGLALMTRNDVIPGKLLKGHTGSAYGLYSIMMFQPEEQFGIVAVTNGCNVDEVNGLNPFLQQVVRSLYRNLLE